MKTIVALATLFTSLAITTPVAADAGGSCHFHGNKPASQATVAGCARQRIAALIKAGKLDASWQNIQADKTEQVDGKKGKEWKLTFKNPKVADASKQTLYMFYTPPGNFIAANFTGQ